MNKVWITAALVASIFATAAEAADIAARPAYTKAPVPPVAGWTGFYAGVNVGYGFNDPTVSFSRNDPASALTFPTGIPAASYNVEGVLGGAQIGYNWQISPAGLLGLEADFQGSNIKGSTSATFVGAIATPFFVNTQQSVEWFGTVRGRAGWLASNKLLVFATGGLAYGSVKDSVAVGPLTAGGVLTVQNGFSSNCALGVGVPCIVAGQSKIQAGYTAGGGLEYAAWQNVSLKLEYLYVNLGSRNQTATALVLANPATAASSVNAHFSDLDFQVVRAGMNWRF